MLDTQEDLLRAAQQREYRQLSLALEFISAYKKAQLEFDDLVLSLESLLDQIREADKTWRKKYWEHLDALLTEYAFYVYDKKTHFSDDDLKCIDDALNGIEQLVKEQMKQYEPYLDDAEYE